VTKNSDGSYHFSWLHVDSRTGYLVDGNNCIVDLHGFNTGGTEYGDAVGGFPGATPQRLTWFKHLFNMNYLRISLNVGWWNSNVYVPAVQMYYRAWIQQLVSWAKANGDYVLLNRKNEYTIPPCGGSITYCPAQAEPSDIDDWYPQERFNSGHLLDQTLVFWQSVVSLYKNDPAVLYSTWDELHQIDGSTWRKIEVTLITAIRAINPRSMIIVGSNDWSNSMGMVVSGKVADLNYPNLVYDWHIYVAGSGTSNGLPCSQLSSYLWKHWGAVSEREFSFAHSHEHGIVINEWGGCLDNPMYNAILSSYAAGHHIAMAYYTAMNVVDANWTALNSNGLLAQAAYAKFPASE
jgi:hypothetical protein